MKKILLAVMILASIKTSAQNDTTKTSVISNPLTFSEYYSDKKGVLISTATPNGFKTTGFSLNLDYAPTANVLVRFEGRTLNSKDKIFLKSITPKKSDEFFTTSVAISF